MPRVPIYERQHLPPAGGLAKAPLGIAQAAGPIATPIDPERATRGTAAAAAAMGQEARALVGEAQSRQEAANSLGQGLSVISQVGQSVEQMGLHLYDTVMTTRANRKATETTDRLTDLAQKIKQDPKITPDQYVSEFQRQATPIISKNREGLSGPFAAKYDLTVNHAARVGQIQLGADAWTEAKADDLGSFQEKLTKWENDWGAMSPTMRKQELKNIKAELDGLEGRKTISKKEKAILERQINERLAAIEVKTLINNNPKKAMEALDSGKYDSRINAEVKYRLQAMAEVKLHKVETEQRQVMRKEVYLNLLNEHGGDYNAMLDKLSNSTWLAKHDKLTLEDTKAIESMIRVDRAEAQEREDRANTVASNALVTNWDALMRKGDRQGALETAQKFAARTPQQLSIKSALEKAATKETKTTDDVWASWTVRVYDPDKPMPTIADFFAMGGAPDKADDAVKMLSSVAKDRASLQGSINGRDQAVNLFMADKDANSKDGKLAKARFTMALDTVIKARKINLGDVPAIMELGKQIQKTVEVPGKYFGYRWTTTTPIYQRWSDLQEQGLASEAGQFITQAERAADPLAQRTMDAMQKAGLADTINNYRTTRAAVEQGKEPGNMPPLLAETRRELEEMYPPEVVGEVRRALIRAGQAPTPRNIDYLIRMRYPAYAPAGGQVR